jgi:hypothetical protein
MFDLRVRNFEFSMPLILRQNCKCRKKYTHEHLIHRELPPPQKKAIVVQAYRVTRG